MAHWGGAGRFYYVCKQVTHSTCPRGIWKSCIVVFSLLGCGDLASIFRLKDDVTSSFGTSDINCIRHFELSHTAAFGPVAAQFILRNHVSHIGIAAINCICILRSQHHRVALGVVSLLDVDTIADTGWEDANLLISSTSLSTFFVNKKWYILPPRPVCPKPSNL